ncbi:hypothetical protein LTR62_007782 [Meristemomyces frigidus]|uniref:Uncharacterized protein n=1 Tax=Meristemomyces frigidus TaxID=1508187 RepID=A0AAN7YM59_9PEZI|nr:hypothetical protein LTR62_007782 [Meristemomyces frigidus]
MTDWGSALGLHWAYRHADRLCGTVVLEIIRPFPTWDDAANGDAQDLFKAFRIPEAGPRLLLEDNLFLKMVLPRGIVWQLKSEEQAYYESSFPDVDSREPVYRRPNELPIEGQPGDVYDIVTR